MKLTFTQTWFWCKSHGVGGGSRPPMALVYPRERGVLCGCEDAHKPGCYLSLKRCSDVANIGGKAIVCGRKCLFVQEGFDGGLGNIKSKKKLHFSARGKRFFLWNGQTKRSSGLVRQQTKLIVIRACCLWHSGACGVHRGGCLRRWTSACVCTHRTSELFPDGQTIGPLGHGCIPVSVVRLPGLDGHLLLTRSTRSTPVAELLITVDFIILVIRAELQAQSPERYSKSSAGIHLTDSQVMLCFLLHSVKPHVRTVRGRLFELYCYFFVQ